MEWIPSYSIPFHSFFTKPNNGTMIYLTPFHSIPPLSINPNIALREFEYTGNGGVSVEAGNMMDSFWLSVSSDFLLLTFFLKISLSEHL